MDGWTWVGASGALVAGLSGSLHCALMCGPLGCAAAGGAKTPAERRKAVFAYQASRVGAYAAVGGVLGIFGRGAVMALARDVQPYLPWVMAAGLIVTAFNLGKHLPRLPVLWRLPAVISRQAAKFSATARAGALGAATPFLPCGLLYGVMLSALATASFAGGLSVMGAFALGGVPALLLAQTQLHALLRFPKLAGVLRVAVPLAAAAVLIVRAVTAEAPRCH